MKIAVVHEHLYVRGGAERVLEEILQIYPFAEIYTAYYIKRNFPEFYKKYNIKESLVGRLYKGKKLLILYPIIFSLMNLKKYDLIISTSYNGQTKAVRYSHTHISYIHTPPLKEWGILDSSFIRKITIPYLRALDYRFAQKPTQLIANSYNVQQRIKNFYKRDAAVIYPPVEVIKAYKQTKNNDEKNDSFLMYGRLEKYKGFLEVAYIFKKYNYNINFFGTGSLLTQLKNMNAQYLGKPSDTQKYKIIAKHACFIMWNEEDFGITMVEAISCGTPVIAYKKGGAKEIIKEGINGVFFKKQTEKSLLHAIDKFQKYTWNRKKMLASVLKFDSKYFKKKFKAYINENI